MDRGVIAIMRRHGGGVARVDCFGHLHYRAPLSGLVRHLPLKSLFICAESLVRKWWVGLRLAHCAAIPNSVRLLIKVAILPLTRLPEYAPARGGLCIGLAEPEIPISRGLGGELHMPAMPRTLPPVDPVVPVLTP
jgi:hypothetical protein